MAKEMKLKRAPKIYPATGAKVSNVSIDVSDNGGFTMTLRPKEPPSTPSDGSSSQYERPKSHVYTTYDEMETVLRAQLTGSGETPAAAEAAEGE